MRAAKTLKHNYIYWQTFYQNICKTPKVDAQKDYKVDEKKGSS